MIFATLGTNETPFDRFVRALDALTVDEELIVQRGSSAVPLDHAHVVDFLPFEAMLERIEQARVVISHAGVGSILVALSMGKRPIVMARRKAFGEAVDDHQLFFAQRLEAEGLVTVAEPDTLAALVASADDARVTSVAPDVRLVQEIRGLILAALDA
jgi:UDP-N-acetylglucosamine transferase subunit ALG13